ncbi:unnamed protein product, partial [Gulo gulo]
RGCGEERAGGREPGTHGPRDREAGRAAHGPTPRPAGTALAPTRSHRPAGEQAAPRLQSPAPLTPEPPPQPLPAHRERSAGMRGESYFIGMRSLGQQGHIPEDGGLLLLCCIDRDWAITRCFAEEAFQAITDF